MNKPIKVRTKVKAGIIVLLMIVVVFSSSNAWTIRQGENSTTGQIYYGSTELIYNTNGKAWTATGTNLQLAIYDLNSTGGAVYLPDGTITISSQVFLVDDIMLCGMGYSTILSADGSISNVANMNGMLNNYDYSSGGNKNITIRDMAIKCNNDVGGIWLREVKNVLISHVKISGSENIGLFVTKSTGVSEYEAVSSSVVISNCIVHHGDNHGIAYTSDYGTLVNCYSYNNSKDGICLEYSRNTTISNCHIYNNTWYGLELSTGANYPAGYRNKAIGNNIYHNGHGGIGFTRGSDLGIYDNYIANNSIGATGHHGIYASNADNVTIMGNIIKNNPGWGIRVTSSPEYFIIIGNNFDGNGDGAVFNSGGTNNQIGGNIGYEYLIIPVSSSAPSIEEDGTTYFDSDNSSLAVYYNSAWHWFENP